MTENDFKKQYARLVEVHPKLYSTKEKMTTIWDHVRDLDSDWLRRIVDSIVMANDPYQEKYDIGYAAQSERRANRSKQFVDDVTNSIHEVNKKISSNGLSKTLGELGSDTVWDAITKTK
jgi:hypothetical protein